MQHDHVDIDVTVSHDEATIRAHVELPEAWDDARPVLERWMEDRRLSSETARSAIDTSINGMREQLNRIESSIDGVVQKQDGQALRIGHHERELHRLHDQQTNLAGHINTVLQQFGHVLGDLNSRAHKTEVLLSGMILCGVVTLSIVVAIAMRLPG